MTSICSHVMAATVLVESLGEMCIDYPRYNKAYLESLLDKLTTKKQAAHRPRNYTAGASHVQPHGDSSEEEEEEEVEEEDLDNL